MSHKLNDCVERLRASEDDYWEQYKESERLRGENAALRAELAEARDFLDAAIKSENDVTASYEKELAHRIFWHKTACKEAKENAALRAELAQAVSPPWGKAPKWAMAFCYQAYWWSRGDKHPFVHTVEHMDEVVIYRPAEEEE